MFNCRICQSEYLKPSRVTNTILLNYIFFYYFKYIDRLERSNCRPKKDDMIPFPFNKNQFSFFVADHLLVVQLCTNPKSDRSLLSCLKVTQCSTSEIRNAPLYNSCILPIQIITGPLPAPWKCKSGRFNVPRVMKTKFPATVMVFGVVLNKGHIMPPHIFEVGLKVNIKVYLDVLKTVVILWCNQVAGGRPGCGSRTRHRSISLKRPSLGFRRNATTLYPSLTGPPPTWCWRRLHWINVSSTT